MTLVLLLQLACFPEILKTEEERFIENPSDDFDGDDYTEDQGDCDDQNPNVSPIGIEVCDGFDNDCNGVVDDNPSDIVTYYADMDGDGFGIESDTELACPADKPDGYIEEKVRNGQVVFDCDDTPADEESENGRAIHPDAEEICDFINNDCDDDVDEDVSDAPLWYFDSDGDGYGDFDLPQPGCADEEGNGPTGHVNNFADCDDSNSDVYPNADEYCNEIDDNCNGIIDEALSVDASIWYADSDGDGFGFLSNAQPSCTQPEGFVSADNVGDCNDEDPLIHPDALESCEAEGEIGVDEDCDGLVNEGSDSTAPIGSTTYYADTDGDGYGDPNATLIQCDIITGYVSNSNDCNDADATLNPDTTWYQDTDGDGEGSSMSILIQCPQPTQYVRHDTDCNDSDALMNTQDADFDGATSCGGDCDDSDSSLNLSDADGDGMDSCSGDCNDVDATIYPNATEYCNEIDDDCDSTIDENDAVDKTAYYEDADADGFGDATSIQYTCPYNQPTGFVDNLDDCDDTLATVYPNADEYCNEIDDNCNGGVDEGTDFNAPPDAVTWYYDLDGDGYGNLNNAVIACDAVVGTVSNSGDCNDSRAASRPGAAEYCNELDDDCDGAVDEDAIDRYDYFLDADGDGHGDPTTQVLECPDYSTGLPNPPPYTAEDGDDCDDSNADISPSADEQCTATIDENCDGDTTFGVPLIELPSWYPDSDGDGYGNPSFVIQLCEQPLNYVDNADDCNDTDEWVHPKNDFLHMDDGVNVTIDDGSGLCQGCVYVDHRELCNGKVDLCENNWNMDLSLPIDELDDDGDGYVECTLDVAPLQWTDLSMGIEGGDDCDDSDPAAFPGAPELCNGVFDDCSDPLFVNQVQSAPDDEIDDDGDCHVECSGFASNVWVGGIHSCERIDSTGQLVQETTVVGGDDCNDNNATIYTGAAYLEPLECEQDADYDGLPDCNLIDLVGETTDYRCDLGVFPPNDGMGPDFVLLQGGLEPLGRYELTHNFYVMTTEVAQQMWVDVMDGTGYSYNTSLWTYGIGSLKPVHKVSLSDTMAFANRLSEITGREQCYSNSSLDPSFTTPYECAGFRLLTEAEWEYAVRSGTTSAFWTGQGIDLGGSYSANTRSGDEQILDGILDPLLIDYVWYAGNNANIYGVNGTKEVGQLQPNGFGLYDMHGNVREWTEDKYGCVYPESAIDPYCSTGTNNAMKGGYFDSSPYYLPASARFEKVNSGLSFDGIRLALTE